MVNAYDTIDGNISDKVVCGTGDYYIDNNSIYFIWMGYEYEGSYTFSCAVINSQGYVNSVSKPIEVTEGAVFDNLGSWSNLSTQYVDIGSEFVPQTLTVTDRSDDTIDQAEVIISGEVDTSIAGIYTISYSVTNIHGVTTIKIRTVEVANLPEITLVGDNDITVALNSSYVELGATAYDDVDGNITANIECGIGDYYLDVGTGPLYFSDRVDYSILSQYLGTYIVTCAVYNSQGKINEVDRIVNVVDVP